MLKIRYEVVTTDIESFTYKTPLVDCDENGEVQLSYSRDTDNHIHIKRITFLNLIGRDEKGGLFHLRVGEYFHAAK